MCLVIANSTIKLTAQIMTAAWADFGMYAKNEVKKVNARIISAAGKIIELVTVFVAKGNNQIFH